MTSYHGRRVLVTGGAGFIGSHLVPKLVEAGARVRVVDNLSRGRRSNLTPVEDRIEFLEADLTISNVCREACEDQDVIFHLASKVGGIGYYMNKPAEVFENNVTMDTLLFQAAQSAEVDKFIFASSAHVYPKRLQTHEDSLPLKESDSEPAAPAISYGWGKIVTEKMIQFRQMEGCRMRSAVLRIVGAFGERQDIALETGSVIPVLCRRAIEYPKRKPFTLLGQGLETRSYCYVGDVVAGLMAAANTLDKEQVVGPLNLGSEGRVRILDVAKKIIEISGKDIEIIHLEAQESGIRGQAVDMSVTFKQLSSWRPTVFLEEGLKICYSDVASRLAKGEV